MDPGQVNEVSFYVRPDRLETTLLVMIGLQDPSIELSVMLPDNIPLTNWPSSLGDVVCTTRRTMRK